MATKSSGDEARCSESPLFRPLFVLKAQNLVFSALNVFDDKRDCFALNYTWFSLFKQGGASLSFWHTRHMPPSASKIFSLMALCLFSYSLSACVSSRPMHGHYGHEDPTRPVALKWEPVRVRAGDTMAKMAERGGVSVQKFAERNRRRVTDRLRLGEVVFAPHGGRVSVMHPAPNTPLPPRNELALRWPVAGVLTSPYGKRWGRMHDGIDIGANHGTAIHAAADGQVLFAGPQRGYGNLVIVRHRYQVTTVYAHAHKTLVRAGQPVSAGQTIALVGQTGHATGPHLHFEVRHGIRPVDPHRLLPQRAVAFNDAR